MELGKMSKDFSVFLGESNAVPGFRLGLERGCGGWVGPTEPQNPGMVCPSPSSWKPGPPWLGLHSHRPLLTLYIASYFSFSSLGLSFWK